MLLLEQGRHVVFQTDGTQSRQTLLSLLWVKENMAIITRNWRSPHPVIFDKTENNVALSVRRTNEIHLPLVRAAA